MEALLIALFTVGFTALLSSIGFLASRMLKLSEAVATCVSKVESINVRQERTEDRLDSWVLSRFGG